MTAATRLAATGWVRNLDLVATVTLLAVFAGLALGKSTFSRPIVVLFGFSYGIFVIPWQLGLTLGVDIEWVERLTIMTDRIRAILLDIVLREEVADNLFFLLMMAMLFWFITVYAGYQLVRNGEVWRSSITIIFLPNFSISSISLSRMSLGSRYSGIPYLIIPPALGIASNTVTPWPNLTR